ncbi:MAG: bifunctional adenosylcobinamide kinase/adenosylcobinamide-phosphate guanylyltransferase [Planctomycetaceae bacterium]
MSETILVLGGTRSGKSRLAERLAGEREPVTLVATASVDPTDAEMSARIARHRTERPAHWTTVEAPRDLEGVLAGLAARDGSVVIDCVTLWISNLMLGQGEGEPLEDEAILAALDRAARAARGQARVIWVSNEVGSGIIPINPLARRFADLQGWANQRLAAACDSVVLCVAGLSVRLK